MGQQAGLADSLQQYYSANSIPLQYIIGDVILVSYSLFLQGHKLQREAGNRAELKELVVPSTPIQLSKEGLPL